MRGEIVNKKYHLLCLLSIPLKIRHNFFKFSFVRRGFPFQENTLKCQKTPTLLYYKVIRKLSKVIINYLKEKPAPVFSKNFSELNSFFVAHICEKINISSRSQMFLKLGILESFTIFTGKHLRWSLFFKNVEG